jgi:hypothetical protein
MCFGSQSNQVKGRAGTHEAGDATHHPCSMAVSNRELHPSPAATRQKTLLATSSLHRFGPGLESLENTLQQRIQSRGGRL